MPGKFIFQGDKDSGHVTIPESKFTIFKEVVDLLECTIIVEKTIKISLGE